MTMHVRKLHFLLEISRVGWKSSYILHSLDHCLPFPIEMLSELTLLPIFDCAVIIGLADNNTLFHTAEMMSPLWFCSIIHCTGTIARRTMIPSLPPERWAQSLQQSFFTEMFTPKHSAKESSMRTTEILSVACLHLCCHEAAIISSELISPRSCQWDTHCRISSYLWLMCKYHRSQAYVGEVLPVRYHEWSFHTVS